MISFYQSSVRDGGMSSNWSSNEYLGRDREADFNRIDLVANSWDLRSYGNNCYDGDEPDEVGSLHRRSANFLHPGQIHISPDDSVIFLPNLPNSYLTPSCINCGEIIHAEIAGWRDSVTCKICRWPMCTEACRCVDGEVVNSHRALECSMLHAAGVEGFRWSGEPNYYLYLWSLRIMLFKQQNEESFDHRLSVLAFDRNHQFDRIPRDFVDHLTKMFPAYGDYVSFEELCSISEIVHWKFRPLVQQGNLSLQQQPLIIESLIAHSCVPNLEKSNILSPINWTVLTTICPNDLLTCSYDLSSIFSPKSERQQRLNSLYQFWCSCPRCSDHSEFGTYFSLFPCWSEQCVNAQTKSLVRTESKIPFHSHVWHPSSYIEKYKRNTKGLWCNCCRKVYSGEDVANYQLNLKTRLDRSRHSLTYLTINLKRENESRKLHITHHLFFEASWNVLKLLSESDDIKNISFLDEHLYNDYLLPAESVHWVVKKFYPSLLQNSYKNSDDNNSKIFRVIFLIRLAILLEDLENNSLTLPEVERRLQDICYTEPAVFLSEVPKEKFLRIYSYHDDNSKPDIPKEGSFEFVENIVVREFVSLVEKLIAKKTAVWHFWQLQRLEPKDMF